MAKKKYRRYSSEFKRHALKRASEDGMTDIAMTSAVGNTNSMPMPTGMSVTPCKMKPGSVTSEVNNPGAAEFTNSMVRARLRVRWQNGCISNFSAFARQAHLT